MSVTRKQKLGAIDLDIMEEAADECNYRYSRNKSSRLWGSRTQDDCDLVVHTDRNMDIGFKQGLDGEVEVHYDHYLREQYENLMSTYFEKLIQRKGRGRFSVLSKEKVGNKLRLTVRKI